MSNKKRIDITIDPGLLKRISGIANKSRSAFIEEAVSKLLDEKEARHKSISEAINNSYGAVLPAVNKRVVYKNVKPIKLNTHIDAKGRKWTYGFGTHEQVEALNIEKDFNTALKTMNSLILIYKEINSINDNKFHKEIYGKKKFSDTAN